MQKNHLHPLIAFLILFIVTLGMLAVSERADAGLIEGPDREVIHGLQVTYAEPIPSDRFHSRHYFELNDGSAWRYPNYRACARWDRLPNRICKTVFWYAR